MKVPFADPMRVFDDDDLEQIMTEIESVILTEDPVDGASVRAFESEFARYCGVGHVVTTGSGTDAVMMALSALNCGAKTEVITVGYVCTAVIGAVVRAGLTPVLVDIDKDTLTIDPDLIRDAVTERTVAILPVHLYGLMADMDAVTAVAAEHDIVVVEAAGQAVGARYKGSVAGSIGEIGCISFHPRKLCGGWGHGGAVVTDCPQLARRAKAIGRHGRLDTGGPSVYVGTNSSLDTIQAVVLRRKLALVDELVAERMDIFYRYRDALGDLGSFQIIRDDKVSAVQHVVIGVDNADKVLARLVERGVPARIQYRVPIYEQAAFCNRVVVASDMKVTDYVSKRTISLPVFNRMRRDEIDFICSAVRDSIEQ